MNFALYLDYIVCPIPVLGAPLSSILFEDIEVLLLLLLLLLLLYPLSNKLVPVLLIALFIP